MVLPRYYWTTYIYVYIHTYIHTWNVESPNSVLLLLHSVADRGDVTPLFLWNLMLLLRCTDSHAPRIGLLWRHFYYCSCYHDYQQHTTSNGTKNKLRWTGNRHSFIIKHEAATTWSIRMSAPPANSIIPQIKLHNNNNVSCPYSSLKAAPISAVVAGCDSTRLVYPQRLGLQLLLVRVKYLFAPSPRSTIIIIFPPPII